MRNSCEIRVGRLLEVSVDAGYRTAADVDELSDMIEDTCASAANGQLVIMVANWRRCPLMSADAAARLSQRMKRNNINAERAAGLASTESPTGVLQFLRVIREAEHPQRKLFYEPAPLIGFLRPVLSSVEVERLREFILESSPSQRAPLT